MRNVKMMALSLGLERYWKILATDKTSAAVNFCQCLLEQVL
jgi:hypothetical protein